MRTFNGNVGSNVSGMLYDMSVFIVILDTSGLSETPVYNSKNVVSRILVGTQGTGHPKSLKHQSLLSSKHFSSVWWSAGWHK